MFDLKSPCVSCPFRKGVGETFLLCKDRILGIIEQPAFQCHKTVVYGFNDETGEETNSPGDNPQQCAGLMAILHREGRPNQIMQVAQRLDALDPTKLDPRGEAYDSLAEAMKAHGHD